MAKPKFTKEKDTAVAEWENGIALRKAEARKNPALPFARFGSRLPPPTPPPPKPEPVPFPTSTLPGLAGLYKLNPGYP